MATTIPLEASANAKTQALDSLVLAICIVYDISPAITDFAKTFSIVMRLNQLSIAKEKSAQR